MPNRIFERRRRKKEGKFITTRYTKPLEIKEQLKASTPDESIHGSEVPQISGIPTLNPQGETVGYTTATGVQKDLGTTSKEGTDAEYDTKYKRQYQADTREVHSKKRDKALSKATGTDVYDVRIRKKLEHRTKGPEGQPETYTFTKYKKKGGENIEKSSKTKVVTARNEERLARKAARFSNPKNVSQGERGMVYGGDKNILGRDKTRKDTFVEHVRDLEGGTGNPRKYKQTKRK